MISICHKLDRQLIIPTNVGSFAYVWENFRLSSQVVFWDKSKLIF